MGGKNRRERKVTVPLFKVEEVMVLGISHHDSCTRDLLEAKRFSHYLSKPWPLSGKPQSRTHQEQYPALAQHAAHADAQRRMP